MDQTESIEFLQIEPTTRCNFICGFCYGRKMDQNDLDMEIFRKSLDLFPRVREVELHGQGEPLSHPRFMEMVELCRQRGASVSTITNGSMFTANRIEQILDAGIKSILVSIESPDPREFQAIRGGKLEKLKRGIAALIAARDRRGLELPVVGFAVTVLKQTRDMLPDIAQLYSELGMDGGLAVHMLIPMPTHIRAYDNDMTDQLLSRAEQAMVWAKYARIVQSPEYRRSRVVHACDTIYGYGRLPEADGAGSRRNWIASYRSCPWLDAGLYINRHGDMTACSRILDAEKYSLGNLAEDSVDQVMAEREDMARQIRGGRIPEACEGCFIAKSISTRLDNLMPRKLDIVDDRVDELWASPGTDDACLGEVPFDPPAARALLAHCDGTLTTRDIIDLLAGHWGVDTQSARVRVLPLAHELIRKGVLRARGASERGPSAPQVSAST